MPAPRICCVDKTQYVFCPHCGGSYNPNEMWKVTFCSKNCKSIYETCNAYANNQIKASEAKDILSRLDLSKIELFPNGIKKNIFDILSITEKVVPVVEEKKEEVIKPVEVIPEPIEVKAETSEVEETEPVAPVVVKKRYKKPIVNEA